MILGADLSKGITAVSVDRINSLYPKIIPNVCNVLYEVKRQTGRTLNVAWGLRSIEEQQTIYEIGRKLENGIWVQTFPNSVKTEAIPGHSWHNYGLAWDISWQGVDPYLKLQRKDERERLWNLFGKITRECGFQWGGDWNNNGIVDFNDNDLVHSQLTYGLKIVDALELYQQGGLQEVWKYLDSKQVA